MTGTERDKLVSRYPEVLHPSIAGYDPQDISYPVDSELLDYNAEDMESFLYAIDCTDMDQEMLFSVAYMKSKQDFDPETCPDSQFESKVERSFEDTSKKLYHLMKLVYGRRGIPKQYPDGKTGWGFSVTTTDQNTGKVKSEKKWPYVFPSRHYHVCHASGSDFNYDYSGNMYRPFERMHIEAQNLEKEIREKSKVFSERDSAEKYAKQTAHGANRNLVFSSVLTGYLLWLFGSNLFVIFEMLTNSHYTGDWFCSVTRIGGRGNGFALLSVILNFLVKWKGHLAYFFYHETKAIGISIVGLVAIGILLLFAATVFLKNAIQDKKRAVTAGRSWKQAETKAAKMAPIVDELKQRWENLVSSQGYRVAETINEEIRDSYNSYNRRWVDAWIRQNR